MLPAAGVLLRWPRPKPVVGIDDQAVFPDLPSSFTGAVIGEWATNPDDAIHDTALWIRPTNLAFASETLGLALDATDIALTIIVAPIFCIADFIFGGGDCLSDAGSFSHTVNPLTLVDEGEGILEEYAEDGSLTSNDWPLAGRVALPALWHFASVAKSGQFNHTPGFKGVSADIGASGGPSGWSLPDTELIVLTDLLGLTVQSEKSDGIPNYSQYADGGFRSPGDWIDAAVGHTEFEPVNNLGHYGWDKFKSHTYGARGLGWVLHAIGDADQPHHTAGVLGYGHSPWEKFANLSWQGNYQEDNITAAYPHLAAEMGYAFRWWKYMDDLQTSRGTTDVPVSDLIKAIAFETFALPVTKFGQAFQTVNLLDTPSPDDSDIIATYGPQSQQMLDLMERTTGASLAFLAKASDFVAPVTIANDPCTCPTGSSRFGQTITGDVIPSRDGLCHPCGTDVFSFLPDWANGECLAVCPPDQPTLQSGVCTSVGACSSTAPFSVNGTCVATCPSTSVIANHRDCVATCPAGTAPDSSHFCIAQPPPKSPAICGDLNGDSTVSCCGKDGGLCGTNSDCCSHSCRDDGICLTGSGGTCVINNDCLSGTCIGGKCQPGHPGAACAAPADCVTFKCVGTTCAPADPGAPCTMSNDCVSTLCGTAGTCVVPSGTYCGSQSSLCLSQLCIGGFCVGDNGDSCNVNSGCGSGSCINGVCKGALGAVCKGNSGCQSADCEQGVCKAGTGGTCQTSSDCGTGFTCPQPGGSCCALPGTSCVTSATCCSQFCDTSQSTPGVCGLGGPG